MSELRGRNEQKTMKKIFFIVSIFVLGNLGFAAPLAKNQIASDAKWLAHIDFEKLTESSIGSYLLEITQGALAEEMDGPVSVNLEAVLQELHSATAYGTTFEDHPENHSILMIESGDKLKAIIDAFMIQIEESNEGEEKIKALENTPFETYLLDGELHLSFPKEGLIIAGKSFEQIERALSVIEGEIPSAAESDSGLELSGSDSAGFFFLASANGLDRLQDVPPQARLLQKATGAQIALGESAAHLHANLVLSTSGPKVSDQLSRILEGIIALVSFAQVGNQNLDKLTEGMSVQYGDDYVSLDMKYPTEDTIKMLSLLIEEVL